MNSKVVTGEVVHVRYRPVRHQFRYPLYFFVFDLDELPTLHSESWLLGYNSRAVVSVRDSDFLSRSSSGIREKLARLLEESGAPPPSRVELITFARYFNYVFSPVSFFLCYGEEREIRSVVAHVNNTFNEAHVYVLPSPVTSRATPEGWPTASFECEKAFHVSPFLSRTGSYKFRFAVRPDFYGVSMFLEQDGERVLFASLGGEAKELTAGSLCRTLLKYPVAALLNFPRILFEAGRLYYQKRLPVVPKPPPASSLTFSWNDEK